MSAHKFVVGQRVAFRPQNGQLVNRRGVFIVARQLPETGGMFQKGSNNNRPDAFVASGGAWAVSSPSRRC